MVGHGGVLQVLVAEILEFAAAERGAETVDHHGDETEFSHGVEPVVVGAELLRHVLIARSLVDIFHHGIFFRGIEVGGTLYEAPHHRFAVAAGSGEYFGRTPAFSGKGGDVGPLDFGNGLAVGSVAQGGNGGHSRRGNNVDEPRHVGGEHGFMVPFAGGEVGEVAAVEIHAVIVDIVGIFSRIHSVGTEIYAGIFLVDLRHLAHVPLPFRHLIKRFARGAVVEIYVVVAVALARPQEALSVGEHMAPYAGIVDIFRMRFLGQRAHVAGFGVEFEQAVVFMAALVVFEYHRAAVGAPLGIGDVVLVGEKHGRRDQRPDGVDVEHGRNLKAQFVARFGIFLFVQPGLQLSGRGRFNIVNISLFSRADSAARYLAAVGAPRNP